MATRERQSDVPSPGVEGDEPTLDRALAQNGSAAGPIPPDDVDRRAGSDPETESRDVPRVVALAEAARPSGESVTPGTKRPAASKNGANGSPASGESRAAAVRASVTAARARRAAETGTPAKPRTKAAASRTAAAPPPADADVAPAAPERTSAAVEGDGAVSPVAGNRAPRTPAKPRTPRASASRPAKSAGGADGPDTDAAPAPIADTAPVAEAMPAAEPRAAAGSKPPRAPKAPRAPRAPRATNTPVTVEPPADAAVARPPESAKATDAPAPKKPARAPRAPRAKAPTSAPVVESPALPVSVDDASVDDAGAADAAVGSAAVDISTEGADAPTADAAPTAGVARTESTEADVENPSGASGATEEEQPAAASAELPTGAPVGPAVLLDVPAPEASAEPSDAVEPSDAAGPADAAGPSDAVEPSDDAGPADAAEPADSGQVAADGESDGSAAESAADAGPAEGGPAGPERRAFRPPWWAGNKTAAAAAVETPRRPAPVDDGPTPASKTGAAAPAALAVVTPGDTSVAPRETAAPAAPREAPEPTAPAAGRLDPWFAAHGSALLWLIPVMVLAAVVTALGLGAPARTAQEALYTGYVWDFLAFGDIAPFTAWAQHPPLGWMQMAAYVQVTGAFDRWDLAVLAVRESMVLFAAATVGAAWLLARRVGLSRPVATVAAVVLALSPFALAQHAAVSLENVAAPWLLIAFVLATSRRMQPLAFALSAVAFAVAVMSAETAVIALPFLAWTMISATVRGSRVWPIVAAAVTLQVIAGGYLVIASNDPAAVAPAAPVFGALGAGPAAIATWWSIDPVLLALTVVGAAAGVVIRRLRPIAVLTLAGVAVLALPGVVTPDGLPALIVPFGVVTLVGATEQAVRAVRARGVQRSAVPIAFVAVVALGTVVAAPLVLSRLPAALAGRADDASGRAEQWLLENAEDDAAVLVDNAARVDFLRAGWARDRVATYDSGAAALPQTWTDAEWAIIPAARADDAAADSVVVASFDGVDVRRVLPGTVEAAEAAEADRAALRAALGAEVVQNPDIELADADRDLLADGQVDDRIVSVLGALTIFGRLDVAGFPVVAGEADGPRRQVALAAAGEQPLVADGELTAAGRDVVDGLLDRYTPESATVQGGLLVLRYPITLGEPAE